MDYKRIIAASLNLDIDYAQMSKELVRSMSSNACVPFSYDGYTAYSLFLRESTEPTTYSYRGAKSADIASWSWNELLDIPYTIKAIEELPFNKLGTVRVVYFPNIPCKIHTDWDDPTDYEHTLGLSLIPQTADTVCRVYIDKEDRWVEIPGNAMLLNDSVPHAVPEAKGIRITMRLFGEIDYDWFKDKISLKDSYFF